MKVLIIPEYESSGGTLSFLKKLLKIHSKYSIETAILIEKAQAQSSILDFFKKLGAKVYIGQNRTSIFRKAYISMFYDFFFCWKTYSSFKPDLIVVSNASCGLMLGSLLYPKPVVFIMHSYPERKIKGGILAFIKWVIKASHKFVTVSDFSANNLSAFMGIPRSSISTVYNSYGSTNKIENYVLEESKDKLVLTIGHVTEYKNPETWLKVAAHIVEQRPEVKFIWLGDGELLNSMRVKVQKLGVEKNVIFLGHCDYVGMYYKNATIYFQPSLRESHGIAVVEAMSFSLPCVTSDIGGLPESVVDGTTGFTCQPNDIENFCLRITTLLDSSNTRNEMGAAGKERARRLFSEDIQEKKFIDLYNEALSV
jgi:glycosyltransferase involved in cell wall biosynthesis